MKRKQKFPNETVERLTALRGILNMHERAIEAGEPCKLNGESRAFDMAHWDCKTAACALGSAALNPWFKERGLHIRHILGGGYPTYENNESIAAGVAFFGISWTEANELFWPDYYPAPTVADITPAMVRERVDALIAKYSTVQP